MPTTTIPCWAKCWAWPTATTCPICHLVALGTACATSICVSINNKNDLQEFLPDVTLYGLYCTANTKNMGVGVSQKYAIRLLVVS